LFVPRQPQVDGRRAFLDYKGGKGALLALDTGIGKTALAAWIACKDYLDAGGRVVWVAHTIELVEQPYETLKKFFPEYAGRAGLVQNVNNEYDKDIVFCSKQTIVNANRLEPILAAGWPRLLIVDEAHHSPSMSYKKIINRIREGGCDLMGLSATPDRDDDLNIGGMWDIVYAYGIIDGIRDGHLLQPYAATVDIPDLDLTKLGGRRDYNDKELWRELSRVHIVDHTVDAIKAWHKAESLPFRDSAKRMRIGDRSTIVFTASIEQSEQTTKRLRDEGFEARHVSGITPKSERRRLLRAFQGGHIQFLCNSQVLKEGVDLPRASAEVLVRPTKSWSLYKQMVGRVLRATVDDASGDALILDLSGGATVLHNLVAAPVLVASGCLDSPDNEHKWLDAGGLGVCNFCMQTVPCAKRGGPHYYKGGECVACGAKQCESGPNNEHHFIPWDEGKRVCLHCGFEIVDRTSSIIGKKSPKSDREKAAWQRLKCPGHVWAVHMGRLGILFMVKRAEGWEPYWWPRSSIPKSLSSGAVPAEYAALLSNDVLRKCNKVNGLYGGKSTGSSYRQGFKEAEDIARKFTLWSNQ
jgi:superfamily II DNA or RNA helicase